MHYFPMRRGWVCGVFCRYHSALGFAGMTVDEAHGVSMMQQGIAGTLVFATTRHQASALRLELNADMFTLSSSVASGTIGSNVVAAFPANAQSTTVAVTCVVAANSLLDDGFARTRAC